MNILEYPSGLEDSTFGISKTSIAKGIQIEFKDVWFRYPNSGKDWIFKGLNLKIENGEKVGIVMKEGSGKSTLVYLIMRFYEINSGKILVNGININSYKLSTLREIIGFVEYDPVIFSSTLGENIMYGMEQVSQ